MAIAVAGINSYDGLVLLWSPGRTPSTVLQIEYLSRSQVPNVHRHLRAPEANLRKNKSWAVRGGRKRDVNVNSPFQNEEI